MAEVRWSLSATADLEALEAFIARDSPIRATNFIDGLVGAVEKLADHPELGRVVPEYRRHELRELIHRGNRIIYLVEGKHLTILRVIHGARDFRSAFEQP